MSVVHELARRWWTGELGAAGTLLDVVLAPAEAVYRAGTRARNRAFDRGLVRVARATVPAISVGNIAVGGTGKTPFSSWLARRLKERGERPAILHGGYASDEPELHRRWTPDVVVVAGAERSYAAIRAVALGATVLVLDDAFQHRRFHRDLDIVLVSAERWRRTTRLLPRGPWREPPGALTRADVVVVTRKTADTGGAQRVAAEVRKLTGREPVMASLCAGGWRTADGQGSGPPPEPAVLVAGVADPGLVRETARAAGAEIAGEARFADHRDYSEADVRRILTTAAGRPIITTEKDWVKLEPLLGSAPVWVLEQQVVIEAGEAALDEALTRVLS